MILHNDQDAFRVLLETIHNETGYRKDVLEKDYYVVLSFPARRLPPPRWGMNGGA